MPYANFCSCRCSSKCECVTSLSGSYCNAYNYMWMSYEPSCALMMQYFRLFVRHILRYLLVATAIRCNTSELVLASLWSRHRAETPVNKCPEIRFSGFQKELFCLKNGFQFLWQNPVSISPPVSIPCAFHAVCSLHVFEIWVNVFCVSFDCPVIYLWLSFVCLVLSVLLWFVCISIVFSLKPM